MQTYQCNDFADATICVPIKVAKRLKIRPGAILSAEAFADLREAMGARREWPRSTPKMGFFRPGTIKEMK